MVRVHFVQANIVTPAEQNKPKLLDQVRAVVRYKHYSIRTEDAYVQWIRQFILFHNKRHPLEMGEAEIRAFLTHLAVNRKVTASTQNQALCALLFLYKQVLRQEMGWVGEVERAKPSEKLPVVLTRQEAAAVLSKLSGTCRLMAGLLYGCGLRLMECVRLRVKDVDFGSNQIVVRGGKGDKDRVTMTTTTPLTLPSPARGEGNHVHARSHPNFLSPCGRGYR